MCARRAGSRAVKLGISNLFVYRCHDEPASLNPQPNRDDAGGFALALRLAHGEKAGYWNRKKTTRHQALTAAHGPRRRGAEIVTGDCEHGVITPGLQPDFDTIWYGRISGDHVKAGFG